MKSELKMSEFLHQIKQSEVAKNYIPLQMGMGWPVLSIRNDMLCVTVPFYKVVMQPEDNTLLYPFSHTLTVLWSNCQVVEYKNLKYDGRYEGVDFSKPVGTFRHDAVKNLNKAQYQEKRNELYELYDELIESLYSTEEFSEASETRMKGIFSVLMEPAFRPYYKDIDIDFYNRLL